ncbi:hypothetical protein MML48_5g00013637 [Holotrichia oblita]|uniref:Uncharacterized protein n=1 Tax=Holotrichia oblita TaxID=644536 RepID=A0ACB9T456_HOLOL|nr:hypothetical protein MML48_5g00013637 [Holotrichia oblita]
MASGHRQSPAYFFSPTITLLKDLQSIVNRIDHDLDGLLRWQIKNEEYYDQLADKIIIINEVFTHLKNRKSGVFIIIPDNETVLVYRKIINADEDFTTGNDSGDNAENNTFNNDHLFSALTQVEQLLGLYSYQNLTKNLTSTKYQQMIYDELGDRDFDSFEINQHELLKKKILFALYGPPKQLKDGDIGYEAKEMKEMETLYNQIRTTNNKYSKWNDRIVITFIYNCTEPLAQEKDKKKEKDENYNPDNDFIPVPVIVLRKCKRNKKEINGKRPCRVFIDSNGRVYQSWDYYLKNNVLPRCQMIYPRDGKYQSKLGSSKVLLDNKPSPSNSSIFKLMQVADIGSGIFGFASGVVLIATAFTPVAAVTVPVAVATGIATGAYSTGRSVYNLKDRDVHGQSINITNAESRAAYLNIAAGVGSIVGAGATRTVSTLVRSGSSVGPVVEGSITLINSANLAIGGTAFINACYDIRSQYCEDGVVPSALTIAQLGSSLFFFGNSIYNFRTGAALVKEIQTTTLNEIHDGLRSNRHRKTFNKMLKETVRIKGEARGRAEVIATLRNSASRDDILAVLTRSNKNFNKNDVRFAAEGGGISLNGVKVDILEFGTLQKNSTKRDFQ